MFKKYSALRLLSALILFCGILSAQDREKKPSEDQRIESYLKYLKEVRIEQIKLRLGVSDDRANAIAAKWSEFEAPIRRIHQESMTVWRQMLSIIQEASPEREKSRKIKPLSDQYTALRNELYAARLRLYQELPLMGDTPIQQARILFLMEEMERKERDGLKARATKRDPPLPD